MSTLFLCENLNTRLSLINLKPLNTSPIAREETEKNFKFSPINTTTIVYIKIIRSMVLENSLKNRI